MNWPALIGALTGSLFGGLGGVWLGHYLASRNHRKQFYRKKLEELTEEVNHHIYTLVGAWRYALALLDGKIDFEHFQKGFRKAFEDERAGRSFPMIRTTVNLYFPKRLGPLLEEIESAKQDLQPYYDATYMLFSSSPINEDRRAEIKSGVELLQESLIRLESQFAGAVRLEVKGFLP